MEIQTERPNETTLILHISGRFDAHTVGQVKALWLADEKIQTVVADLANTTFIDSIALSVLISGLKTVRQRKGEFVLANPAEVVQVILELTSLDRVFKSAPSVSEALQLAEQP
jgi:anti-sigma B factor antagonist